jgi:hypothetical protein
MYYNTGMCWQWLFKKMYVPMKDEVAWVWTKLHIDKPHSLYPLVMLLEYVRDEKCTQNLVGLFQNNLLLRTPKQ